jgi:hypothetical protein
VVFRELGAGQTQLMRKLGAPNACQFQQSKTLGVRPARLPRAVIDTWGSDGSRQMSDL